MLAQARSLAQGDIELGRTARRSSALLARHALEAELGDWLVYEHQISSSANFTVQLICLQHLHPDKALARRVAWTWSALSAACHHRGYELPPPLTDLLTWLDTVDAFIVQGGRDDRVA
jgi:hypothetical protein